MRRNDSERMVQVCGPNGQVDWCTQLQWDVFVIVRDLAADLAKGGRDVDAEAREYYLKRQLDELHDRFPESADLLVPLVRRWVRRSWLH